MQNKSKFLEEISRMIELSESNQNKANLLKESFKSKILKEADDDEFAFFDLDDEEGDDNFKGPIGKIVGNPGEDIPLLLKIALLSKNISDFQRVALGVGFKDVVSTNNLNTKAIERPLPLSSDDEEGGELSRKGYVAPVNLYPKISADEFRKWTINHTAPSEDKRYVVSPKEADAMYKWMKGVRGVGDYNNIGFDITKPSDKGTAQLNFLGRVMSGRGLNGEDKRILEILNPDAAKSNATEIVKGYYTLVSDNVLFPLLNMIPTPENVDMFELALANSLNKLNSLKETNYDPEKGNLTSWFLQIIKNDIKNQLKKVTEYIPDFENARVYLENRLANEGQLTIASKFSAKNLTSADEMNEKEGAKDTYRYLYIYRDVDAVENFLSDLMSATKSGQQHPFSPYNLSPRLNKELFKSVRKGTLPMSPEEEEELSDTVGYDEFEIASEFKENEATIKSVIDNAVEWMVSNKKIENAFSKTPGKTIAGNPKKYEEWKASKASKIRELANKNIVNFIYNFLLTPMVGETVAKKITDPNTGEERYVYSTQKTGDKTFRDVESSGKINAEVMKNWLNSQNEIMLKALTSLSDKPYDEVKNIAIDNNLLLAVKDDGEFDKNKIQPIWIGLMDYLKENPEVVNKLKSLGETSPEGEELDIDLKLEQKIRAKIQKMLQESFVISEEEEDFMDNISNLDKQINIASKRFENVLSGKYSPEDLKSEIFKAIEEGNYIKWNFENSKEHGQHKYISSVLASIYNLLNSKQQENVIAYMFLTFFPNQMESQLIRKLSSKLSGGDYYSGSDIAWDAVVSSDSSGKMLIEKAIENYSPDKGVFANLLIEYIFRQAKNIQKTKGSHVEKGERKYVSSISMDKEDEEGMALKDKISNVGSNEREVEDLREKLDNLISKIENKNILSNSELNLLKDARLFINDIVDESGLNYELLSTRINAAIERDENVNTRKPISVSNIGSQMSNLTKKTKKAKEEGLI